MTMIHFVYPHDNTKIASPWCIGNEVIAELKQRGYGVTNYAWDDRTTVLPSPGDILIGHPAWESNCIMQNSCKTKGWKRILLLAPPHWPYGETILNECLTYADKYLCIAGPYWDQMIKIKWWPKAKRLDMAIDIEKFPRIKGQLASPGTRGIAYIGCTVPQKGPGYLEKIISRLDWLKWGHFGYGRINGAEEYGFCDFHTQYAMQQLAKYDIIIAPGKQDANPTTILEALCWGLYPIATITSGWSYDVCSLISSDNASEAAAAICDRVYDQDLDEKLAGLQKSLSRYTWSHFVDQIEEEL